MNELSIIPECYIDTNLIESLVPPVHGRYNHQKGCPAVAKKMQEKYADEFSLGIMDNDKKKVSYLEDFSLVADDKTLYVYKHKERHHYIVLITPAVEMFIISAAKELGIVLKDFDVPDTLNDMKRETKQIDAKSAKKYRALFHVLSAATEFHKLSSIVEYLKNNTYSSQMQEIKSIMLAE